MARCGFGCIAHSYRIDHDAEGLRHRLDCTKLHEAGLCRRISNDCHPRDGGRDRLQELQPLALALNSGTIANPAMFAAWPSDVVDEPWATGLQLRKDNRQHGGCFLESHDARPRRSQHHVRRKPGQFRRITTKAIGIGGRPADVDPDIAPDGPAGLLQALNECRQAGLSVQCPPTCASARQRAAYAPAAARGLPTAKPPHCRAV